MAKSLCSAPTTYRRATSSASSAAADDPSTALRHPVQPIHLQSLPAAAPPSSGTQAFGPEERQELYRGFLPLISRLLGQYGDNYELRRDLQGEIYYHFNRLLDEFDPERGVPLKGYLVRKLSAAVYTYARSQWRYKREVPLGLELPYLEEPDLRHTSQGCVRELVRQELVDALPELIAGLSHRQRQVIIWKYFEERSTQEIALLLGIQENTVRSLVRHGLTNLRQQIARRDLTLE